jgi:hypothetical protein
MVESVEIVEMWRAWRLGKRRDHDSNITATHALASCKNLAALPPVFCSTNIKQRPKKDGSTTRCWRRRLFPYLITLQTWRHQENSPVEGLTGRQARAGGDLRETARKQACFSTSDFFKCSGTCRWTA